MGLGHAWGPTLAPPRTNARSDFAHARPITDDGLPVDSFRSLLADLACLTRNTVRYGRKQTMTLLAKPTQFRQRAFELLDVKLGL